MKKMLALVLAVMMILAAIPAMADETVFKMGFDAEYPPYTYMGDDGEYTGFDIEMCQGVCDILGWKVEFVPVNWDTKLISLDAGEVDCIWSGLTIDVIDPEAYTLSMAYSNNSQMILTKKSNNINTLADLAGKIVGVQLGTSADILLQNDQAELAATFGDLLHRADGRLHRRDRDRRRRGRREDRRIRRRIHDARRIHCFRRIRHLLPQGRRGNVQAG